MKVKLPKNIKKTEITTDEDLFQLAEEISTQTKIKASPAIIHSFAAIQMAISHQSKQRKIIEKIPNDIRESMEDKFGEIEEEEVQTLFVMGENTSFEDLSPLTAKEIITHKTIEKEIKEEDYQFLVYPQQQYPHDLVSQMNYMVDNWDLPQEVNSLLLLSSDLLKEENKPHFTGPGETYVLDFDGEEIEAFTQDQNWMPTVIVQAKNTMVWLDQLTRKYKKPIQTLGDIPDEELDEMNNQGFNALWLIGIWKRSYASRRIKQIRGNMDAVSSAYAIYDFEIDERLGGHDAYIDLRDRLFSRGIRLGADMVPNHMAADSKWVVEHPEWFISTENPPYPAYTFNGEDLCENEYISIYIEDKYYSEKDAAVVFKHHDRRNNSVQYIYHGNDGTAIPWNDTAQLDYLNKETREQVINTIIKVAKMFPIIRFDAAMTLVKRHIRRLWYPKQGEGGDIASRSRFALNDEEFERLIPMEFWREVVDRINKEVPHTLLLAEAFWMLESYFVRTLGMHRVYNSAFMHMLRDQENAKYRKSIKNTLDFNPEILKRFVNYLTTPDEEPAILQFGDGDKYFGITTLMVTMPGTPMFGHGQFNGFKERYGMEFQRAYQHEPVNTYLRDRHLKEITPLMHKRYIFAEAKHFVLFDFYNDGINEDVYAFSNQSGSEKALVVYNNRFERSTGWINQAYIPENDEEHKNTLFEVLECSEPSLEKFVIFKDIIHQLEYIRSTRDLAKGLYLELDGYQCHVFMEFRKAAGDDYAIVSQRLGGRGYHSIDALIEDLHRPRDESS